MTDHFIAARPLFFTLAVAKLAKLPAHALPPGGPFGAPGPRVSVRARNYLTGTHAPHAVEGHHLNGTEPQHPNLTTLTKITRRPAAATRLPLPTPLE